MDYLARFCAAGTRLVCALLLTGLVQGLAVRSAQAATGAEMQSQIQSAFIVLGPDGAAVARAITVADQCPSLIVDGRKAAMELRAGPSTEAQRPTKSTPELSKPSQFPVRVCEAQIPPGTRRASIGRHRLPAVHRYLRRIVVIGDTGCRLKAKDNAWQACNDPAQYPFARIAAQAAAWKPDAVVHVGDYLYRENPCAPGHPGCHGSAWGYGWDAWQADLFSPARPLLDTAPLILIRGNHENCARGGQGWWRFLDPRPLVPGRDCNDAANDVTGDYSPPYAVPLGRGAQVVVMDLSHAGEERLPANDPRIAQFKESWRKLAALAQGKSFTFAADHYPLLGVAANEPPRPAGLNTGNQALIGVFSQMDTAILPPTVDVLLAGHIHLWEHLDFAGRQPSQFVAGFSGTREDTVPLPDTLPAGIEPAPDAPVHQFNAIVDKFGYMTLTRRGRARWTANVYALDGTRIQHCRIKGRRSYCEAK